MKRSINTTLESDKDTNSTLLKDDTFKSEANNTLEKDTETTNKTTEIDDIEEVSQSKLIFSKFERNNGSVFNVRCSVSYSGTEIWSGFVIENIKYNVSGNVSDDVQGNLSGTVSGNVSENKGMYESCPLDELV